MNIRNNQLTSLPESIGKIGHCLRLLNVENNQLVSLPESLGTLLRLYKLTADFYLKDMITSVNVLAITEFLEETDTKPAMQSY
jgi:Leucine-rich repeat (LRR) protein